MNTPFIKSFERLSHLNKLEMEISNFFAEQVKNTAVYFGYPEIPQNDELSVLGINGLAKLHLNNAGDPWRHGNAKMHTKNFERKALEFVAKLYGIENNYWGYVTNGGTEGNLYGTFMSREFFQEKQQECVFIYSESSHYSVIKNARILNLDTRRIASFPSGEMNYKDFGNCLRRLKEKYQQRPGLIINLNIGTTMTGAIDSLSEINKWVYEYGWEEKNVLIHADAALMGLIYPFIENKEDLFNNGVTSIALSGHKFPGAIHPCGIVLVSRDIQEQAFSEHWIPYIGSRDTTVSGSRNGFSALSLWYLFYKKGVEGFASEAKTCIKNAQYLASELKKINYPEVFLFPNQIIVTFKKPNQTITDKYQLAVEGEKAHVVVMQHITHPRIDRFCQDMKTSLQWVT